MYKCETHSFSQKADDKDQCKLGVSLVSFQGLVISTAFVLGFCC